MPKTKRNTKPARPFFCIAKGQDFSRAAMKRFPLSFLSAFGIFAPPPKRLWTRTQAGALPAEAVRRRLSVGREMKTEMPVRQTQTHATADGAATLCFVRWF